MKGHRRRAAVLRDNRQAKQAFQRIGNILGGAVLSATPTAVIEQVDTPKGLTLIESLAGPPQEQTQGGNYVSLEVIVPHSNFRVARDPEADADLLESVRANGVIQNVLLRPIVATAEHVRQFEAYPLIKDLGLKAKFGPGDQVFQLCAGYRRWEASHKAGRQGIPAVSRHMTEEQFLQLQWMENEHRQNLNPMDRIRAVTRMLRQRMAAHEGESHYSKTKAAEDLAASLKTGKGKRVILQMAQMDERLAPRLKNALEAGELPYTHAAELCALEEPEQHRLYNWLVTQRDINGSLPGTRALQREIAAVLTELEEKRKQEKLFKEQEKKVEFSQEEYNEAVEIVHEVGRQSGKVSSQLLTRRQGVSEVDARAMLSKMQANGIVEKEFRGFYPYNFSSQRPVAAEKPSLQAPAQPTPPPTIEPPKPLTAAQIKKKLEEEERERRDHQRIVRQQLRKQRIEKRYRGDMFIAMARKIQLNHKTLAKIMPNLIFEMWESGDVLPDAYAAKLLGWPEPEGVGEDGYSYEEVKRYSKKHTQKFTPGLMAAIFLYLNTPQAHLERLARSYSIDTKKLRKAAAEQIDAERLKLPQPPSDAKDRALYDYLTTDWHGKEWAKLRKTGATNQQVRDLLCRHFGEWGCVSGPGKIPLAHKGTSNNPRVWFKHTDTGQPDLAGAELIEKVRELLNIEEV